MRALSENKSSVIYYPSRPKGLPRREIKQKSIANNGLDEITISRLILELYDVDGYLAEEKVVLISKR